jgi:hypothetical protein
MMILINTQGEKRWINYKLIMLITNLLVEVFFCSMLVSWLEGKLSLISIY